MKPLQMMLLEHIYTTVKNPNQNSVVASQKNPISLRQIKAFLCVQSALEYTSSHLHDSPGDRSKLLGPCATSPSLDSSSGESRSNPDSSISLLKPL